MALAGMEATQHDSLEWYIKKMMHYLRGAVPGLRRELSSASNTTQEKLIKHSPLVEAAIAELPAPASLGKGKVLFGTICEGFLITSNKEHGATVAIQMLLDSPLTPVERMQIFTKFRDFIQEVAKIDGKLGAYPEPVDAILNDGLTKITKLNLIKK